MCVRILICCVVTWTHACTCSHLKRLQFNPHQICAYAFIVWGKKLSVSSGRQRVVCVHVFFWWTEGRMCSCLFFWTLRPWRQQISWCDETKNTRIPMLWLSCADVCVACHVRVCVCLRTHVRECVCACCIHVSHKNTSRMPWHLSTNLCIHFSNIPPHTPDNAHDRVDPPIWHAWQKTFNPCLFMADLLTSTAITGIWGCRALLQQTAQILESLRIFGSLSRLQNREAILWKLFDDYPVHSSKHV